MWQHASLSTVSQRLDVSVVRNDVAAMKRHPLAGLKSKYGASKLLGDPVVRYRHTRGRRQQKARQ